MSDEAQVVETTPDASSLPEAAPPPDASAPPPEKTPEQAAAEADAARRAERVERAAATERRAAEVRESKRVRQDIARAESERQRLAQERQDWERQRTSEAEAIRKGGLDALKARGLDYTQLTREYIDQSSPEAQAAARMARELEETKTQLQQLTAEQQAAKVEKAYQWIENTLEKRADEFPYAYELSPGAFRASVSAIAQSLRNQGRQPTESVVLKMLDDATKAEHDVRESRRTALQKRSKSPASQASTPVDSRNANPAVRTLTNGDAGQRVSSGGRQKTEAELDDEIARAIAPMLRQA
jgi:hypothetical protein